MIQTVTLNSALSQNWVVCTVCTPRTQVAHTPHAVVRCRRALGAVSRAAAPCRYPLSRHKIVLRYKNPVTRAGCRVAPALLRALASRPGLVVPWRVPAPCLSRHNLVCHDQSWKIGSSPSSFLSCTFFFSSLFHLL